jgi:hypothetical protein
LGIVGLGASLIGGRKEAKAAEASAKAQAAVDAENAKLVDLQIGDAIFRGEREVGQVVREARAAVGRQRVGAGSAYLDLSFGSPLDAIYMSTDNMRRDMESLKRNTQGEVTDLQRQKVNYTAQAAASNRTAKNARTAGTIRSIADAASGAAGIYKAWIDR